VVEDAMVDLDQKETKLFKTENDSWACLRYGAKVGKSGKELDRKGNNGAAQSKILEGGQEPRNRMLLADIEWKDEGKDRTSRVCDGETGNLN
jgi:hypothetical protein